MGARIDDLEKSIGELISEAGLEENASGRELDLMGRQRRRIAKTLNKWIINFINISQLLSAINTTNILYVTSAAKNSSLRQDNNVSRTSQIWLRKLEEFLLPQN